MAKNLEIRERTIRLPESSDRRTRIIEKFYGIGTITILCVVWFVVARIIKKPIILPDFIDTMKEFFMAWVTPRTMSNLWLTVGRVLKGTFYATIVGTFLGLLMGYSEKVMRCLSPIINSIRQVPIMAWVPLAIIWFGLGEGPTLYMIFMSAVFPLIINTIAGVSGIDPNYVNAARSMGAKTLDIYRDIIIPGAFPGFLTGVRLAIGSGWMSVI